MSNEQRYSDDDYPTITITDLEERANAFADDMTDPSREKKTSNLFIDEESLRQAFKDAFYEHMRTQYLIVEPRPQNSLRPT